MNIYVWIHACLVDGGKKTNVKCLLLRWERLRMVYPALIELIVLVESNTQAIRFASTRWFWIYLSDQGNGCLWCCHLFQFLMHGYRIDSNNGYCWIFSVLVKLIVISIVDRDFEDVIKMGRFS